MTSRRTTATRTLGQRVKELCDLCEARGLPLTAPRRAVLEAVISLGTHPTADEVHASAVRRHPHLGRATVYRALESFVEVGVLTKASHTGTAVRYDADVGQHHHLVCLRCDRILDIEDRRLDAVKAPDTSRLGFVVSDVQVQLRGICKECLEEDKER